MVTISLHVNSSECSNISMEFMCIFDAKLLVLLAFVALLYMWLVNKTNLPQFNSVVRTTPSCSILSQLFSRPLLNTNNGIKLLQSLHYSLTTCRRSIIDNKSTDTQKAISKKTRLINWLSSILASKAEQRHILQRIGIRSLKDLSQRRTRVLNSSRCRRVPVIVNPKLLDCLRGKRRNRFELRVPAGPQHPSVVGNQAPQAEGPAPLAVANFLLPENQQPPAPLPPPLPSPEEPVQPDQNQEPPPPPPAPPPPQPPVLQPEAEPQQPDEPPDAQPPPQPPKMAPANMKIKFECPPGQRIDFSFSIKNLAANAQ